MLLQVNGDMMLDQGGVASRMRRRIRVNLHLNGQDFALVRRNPQPVQQAAETYEGAVDRVALIEPRFDIIFSARRSC